MTRLSSHSGIDRSNRLNAQDSLKRNLSRRKREAEKALIRARDSLKILLMAKYPTRRTVEVGDTNSDTAMMSHAFVYEAPPRRSRATGPNHQPLLGSPLGSCPVTNRVDWAAQNAWILFESPSFEAQESPEECSSSEEQGSPTGAEAPSSSNKPQTSSIDCPIAGLKISTAHTITDEELAEGLTQWWSQLEKCWDLAAPETIEPEDLPSTESSSIINIAEFPILFDLLQA